MIIKKDFSYYLSQLQLSPVEAAQLLSVTTRTVYRWLEKPYEISGPAKQALRAWLSLKNYKLPWRPDCVPLGIFKNYEEFADSIVKNRDYSVWVLDIIEKVKKRGGLSLPWQVDLDKGNAKLEKIIEVMFYELHNGKFSPGQYRRIDDQPTNLEHDQYLIEEAIFAIHQALATSRNK